MTPMVSREETSDLMKYRKMQALNICVKRQTQESPRLIAQRCVDELRLEAGTFDSSKLVLLTIIKAFKGTHPVMEM